MSVLTIIGALVVLLAVLIVVCLLLDFFLFAPRRERQFQQNYVVRSLDPTGPFWWLPGGAEKRPYPVSAPQAESIERIRQLQFALLLALIVIGYLSYRYFF